MSKLPVLQQGPCSFVIFGATGNLSQIKLLPALYHLDKANRLPSDMSLFAFGRRPFRPRIGAPLWKTP